MTPVLNIHLPYCIQQVIPGWFVILNRAYKPLGFPAGEWVDYHDHMVKIKYFTTAKAKRLSYKGSDDIKFITLYGDGCNPARSTEFEAAYFKRLSVLLQLKVDEYAIKPAKNENTQKPNKRRRKKLSSGENALPLLS